MMNPLALTTWVPHSTDGAREARRLRNRFAQVTSLASPDKISKQMLSGYLDLVVVGHRSEFGRTHQEGLANLVKGSGCGSIILALCNSGQTATNGTLNDNELWTMGQRMANLSRIRVLGTSRELTFDEVGKGLAFAVVHGDMLIASNPPGSDLWHDFHPQGDIDRITEGLSRI